MRCHSVASFFSPLVLSFHVSVVATRMLVTASPLGRYLVSGSAPKLPTMITLLIDAISHLPIRQRQRTPRVDPDQIVATVACPPPRRATTARALHTSRIPQ